MKPSTPKRGASRKAAPASAAVQPGKTQPTREARNKANTARNSLKIEHYLMEVEKVHGFARAWDLRERLEQGKVSFEELRRR